MDEKNKEPEIIDYLKILYPNNNWIKWIDSLSYNNNRLEIIVYMEPGETEGKKLIFDKVINYEISFAVNEEDKELPQSIIGFDYSEIDNEELLSWEINGDGCVWNFHSSFPVIINLE